MTVIDRLLVVSVVYGFLVGGQFDRMLVCNDECRLIVKEA